MLNQSFRQVFVTNTPNLLASGTTVDLGVGQVGIFDGKTYGATISPTYAKNKTLYLGWGQPDLARIGSLMLGISSNTELTKLIKGGSVTGFSGKKASRGRTESIAVGYDGVDVTKTLTAKCGETKIYYLKLSGQPISTLFSTDGIIQQYHVDAGPCVDCASGDQNCDNVCPEGLADQLVTKINKDPKVNRFVRAKKLLNCNPARSAVSGTVAYTRYQVTQTDSGDYTALGGVQSQYAGKAINVVNRVGLVSTYEYIGKTSSGAPAALSNLNNVIIPDCTTCPAGYTSVVSAFVYVVKRQDQGADVSSTVTTDYTASSVAKLNEEFGQGTYIVQKATAISAASGNDSLTYVGKARQSCVITSPTTTAWTAVSTLTSYPQTYTLTLLDQCNTNRLADVQAAFPTLVVTQTAGTGSESCAHRYEATILSDPLDQTCGIDELKFKAPSSFEGVSWAVKSTAALDCTGCVAGVKIEAAFVNRVTNEVTYDYFNIEYDGVHIEGSQYDPDYNGNPYEPTWSTTILQKIKYPHGDGYWVRKEEIKSLGYTHKHRSQDAGVREAEGYQLQSILEKFYDEYTLKYNFSYKVLNHSQTYTDSYNLTVYFPEGQGKQFETAINDYITSANIQIDPVVL